MPKPVPLPPPGFDELSVDEKIDCRQSLWDRMATTPEMIPVPDWHRGILDEHLKDLEANPAAGEILTIRCTNRTGRNLATQARLHSILFGCGGPQPVNTD